MTEPSRANVMATAGSRGPSAPVEASKTDPEADLLTTRSPLGELRLLARADRLVGVYLPVQHAPPARARPNRLLDLAAAQLAAYFAGELRAFDLPLSASGTAFQQAVWSALAAIPFGQTRSYGELARAVERPSASRAVGAANARNPLAIVVPCHRVIATSGALTGYAGGMAAKRWLLDHERASLAAHGRGRDPRSRVT